MPNSNPKAYASAMDPSFLRRDHRLHISIINRGKVKYRNRRSIILIIGWLNRSFKYKKSGLRESKPPAK
jgi:hypothetical protein